jgi:two-component system, OmpR family, response regulator
MSRLEGSAATGHELVAASGQMAPREDVWAQIQAPHVLAVDSDPGVRNTLASYLGDSGFRVTAVADRRAMAIVLAESVVDLVVLDVELDSLDNIAFLRQLRSASEIPVIMVTRRNEEADRVIGLEIGADDYLTKPFSPRELVARIRSILRRCRVGVRQARPQGMRAYRFPGWELNLWKRRLKKDDQSTVALSRGDFNLLVALLANAQRVLTRDRLIDLSRLHSDDVYNRAIDVQISRLRRKIETDPTEPRYIRTERGVGYSFAAPVQSIY